MPAVGSSILNMVGFLLLFAISLFFFSWVVQITYNASIVNMSKAAAPVTYWQAMAFLVFVMVIGAFFMGARGYVNVSRVYESMNRQ